MVAARLGVGWRLPALVLAGVCLFVGLLSALMLAGLPVRAPEQMHGELMLLGFLGTLIALERAVALRRRWALLAPLALGAGGLLPAQAGRSLQTLGALGLIAIYIAIWRRGGSAAIAIQALGAVLLAAGAALLAVGVPFPAVIPALAAFLVLTIVGERLELARISAPGPRAEAVLVLFATSTSVGAILALLWPVAGTALLGACLLAIGVWLVRHDVALRLWRSSGLPRYAALNLLAGMAWLGIAGAIWLFAGPQAAGPGYDALVHAIGLGFAMSMVLGHAPVILPAVLLRPLPYRPVLYVAAIGLQATLILRMIGDARDAHVVWGIGAVGNVLALLAFLGISASLAARR